MLEMVLACKCDQCGHTWLSKLGKPEQCAKCKTRDWNSVGHRLSLDRKLAEHAALLAADPSTDVSKYVDNKNLAALCHSIVNTAIKKKVLFAPELCENCKEPPKPHHKLLAHHNDYSKPLDVEWLCGPCHAQYHYKQGHRGQQKRELTYETAE